MRVKMQNIVDFIRKRHYSQFRNYLIRIKIMNKVQSDFLDDIKREKVSVTVFLINGVKLQGIVTSQDEECLLLRRDGHTQLIYKHAVSTIMPSVAVDVADE